MTGRLWPKVKKDRRKELAKAIRVRLAGGALGIGELAEALEIEPEEVVVVMRELRGKKSGTLTSAIGRGQTVWSWEEAPKSVRSAKPKKAR